MITTASRLWKDKGGVGRTRRSSSGVWGLVASEAEVKGDGERGRRSRKGCDKRERRISSQKGKIGVVWRGDDCPKRASQE